MVDSGGLQKTTLRKSQFGTGVFAAERISAGELVCGAFPFNVVPCARSLDRSEYVGELVYDETTRSRECVASLFSMCIVAYRAVDSSPSIGARTTFSASTLSLVSTPYMRGMRRDLSTTESMIM